MSTPTNLVNRALRRIGKATVSDLDTSNGKEASVARQFYDSCRRELLEAHNWWFAERRTTLTASATEPTSGYDYAYLIPDDFLRIVSIHPDDSDESIVRYRLGNQGDDDRVIFTDATQVYLRYIFDLKDVAIMPPSFQKALEYDLAVAFAAGLNVALNKVDYNDKIRRDILRRARAVEGVQDYPTRMAEGSWASGREDEDDEWAGYF